MNYFIGTMGFSYSDWKGVFFPSEMPSQKYLSYYSRIFNSVEIDSTFYGIPRKETILRWKSMTPNSFKFCVKMPRSITHDSNLLQVEGLIDEFLRRMELLGSKLAVVLLQFPPSFSVTQLDFLHRLFPYLPREFRYGIEVRDASWYLNTDEFVRLLKSYQIGWVATEYPKVPSTITLTTDFLYIRWIGQHGSFISHNYERIDRTLNLDKWNREIKRIAGQINSVYGFFNNDYAGFAPGTANKFKRIVGLDIREFKPPTQGYLF